MSVSDKQSEAQKQERGGGEERAVHTHTRKDINIKTCTNVRHFLYFQRRISSSRQCLDGKSPEDMFLDFRWKTGRIKMTNKMNGIKCIKRRRCGVMWQLMPTYNLFCKWWILVQLNEAKCQKILHIVYYGESFVAVRFLV